MFRALCFAALAALATPALAADKTAMIDAGTTAQMEIGTTQAIAFYNTDRKGMQVTMVFTDAEGEMLRTRIRLDDGQAHTIVLHDEDDREMRYTLTRQGAQVQMHGATAEEPALADASSAL
ncbi:MAG: hypothetical protein AAGB15_11405 [Pseudomonadota bacterium]